MDFLHYSINTSGLALMNLLLGLFKISLILLLKSWNHTFVSLIPKIDATTKIEHYRSISLCNVSYKIIFKILSDGLKTVLDSIISPTQAGFGSSRPIIDNSIICHEIMHHMNGKKGRLGLMDLKIYMAKAYDRVE